jgi:hypothetical protein
MPNLITRIIEPTKNHVSFLFDFLFQLNILMHYQILHSIMYAFKITPLFEGFHFVVSLAEDQN